LKGYTFLEHTADALIEAEGRTLEEAFANAARGLTDTLIDIETVREKTQRNLTVFGHDLEELLYNWLEILLITVTTDNLVFSTYQITIRKCKDIYELVASARGERLEPKRHRPKTEVKAATYHRMQIRQERDHVTLRFLLDL
jgi:SHS2 domain-containing protein